MRSSKISLLIVAAVMAYGVVGVSAPMIALAQPAQVPVTQETNTLSEASGADTISGTQMAYGDIQQGSDRYSNAEIDHRFNEIRRELLDDRASTIEWWLAAVGVFLAFLAILGLFGFRELWEIKKEAREAIAKTHEATEKAKESANKARRHAEDAEKDQGVITEMRRDMTAESAADNPAIAQQAVDVSKDPAASHIDKAIARAISLQKEGKIEEAIKIWQGIADAITGIANDLAARAWFSVGYLESIRGDKANYEEVISAYNQAIRLGLNYAAVYNNRGLAKVEMGQYKDAIDDYNEAIHLDPYDAKTYTNRGIAKDELGQYKAAITDYDEAIRLEPYDAKIYYNRGLVKRRMGCLAEARIDFEKAFEIAQEIGNKEVLAAAEKNLRKLENGENA